MRRIALLGLTVLLSGCASPFDGFSGFISDTHTFTANRNAPVSPAENVRRVRGEEPVIAPLLPEPGDVWPGPPKPIPTLADIQMTDPNQQLPPPNLNSVPPSVFPQDAPALKSP